MRNLKKLVIVGLLLLLSSTPVTAALYEGIWDSNDVEFPDLGSWETDMTGCDANNVGATITSNGQALFGLWSNEGVSITGGGNEYVGPYPPDKLLFNSTFVWDNVLTFIFDGDTYYAPNVVTSAGPILATFAGDYAGWLGTRLLESESLIYGDYIAGAFLNPTGFIGKISHTAMETGWDDDGNWGVFTHMHVEIDAVPIPSAVWLLGSGLIGLLGFRRKFRKT